MTHDVRFLTVSDEEATLNVLPPRLAQYGVEELFATGSPLRYPDFDLYYLGLSAEDGHKKWRFRLDHRGGSSPLVLHTGGALESAKSVIGDRRFSFALARGSWVNGLPEEASLIVEVEP